MKDEFVESDESESEDSYSDSDYEPDDLEITVSRKRRTQRTIDLVDDQFAIEYHSETDVEEIDQAKACEFCLKFFNIGKGNNNAYLGFDSKYFKTYPWTPHMDPIYDFILNRVRPYDISPANN